MGGCVSVCLKRSFEENDAEASERLLQVKAHDVTLQRRKSSERPLSDDEIEAIKQGWMRVKQTEIGMQILLSLIDKNPDFRSFFGVRDITEVDQLKNTTDVIVQGQRIQGFLDTAVSSLGLQSIVHLNQLCKRIGIIHYHKGVNFTLENWTVFKKTVIMNILDNVKPEACMTRNRLSVEPSSPEKTYYYCNRHELEKEAWNKLMDVIMSEMKWGFLHAAVRNSSTMKYCNLVAEYKANY